MNPVIEKISRQINKISNKFFCNLVFTSGTLIGRHVTHDSGFKFEIYKDMYDEIDRYSERNRYWDNL